MIDLESLELEKYIGIAVQQKMEVMLREDISNGTLDLAEGHIDMESAFESCVIHETADELTMNENNTYELLSQGFEQDLIPLLENMFLYNTSDIVTIFVVLFLSSLGIVLNCLLMKRLCSKMKQHRAGPLILEAHVCAGNLMVLAFYGAEKFASRVGIYWYGGGVLCVTVKTLQCFSFHFLSASLAILGMDRMICILQPFRILLSRKQTRVIAIWIYSILFTCPHPFLWGVVEVNFHGKVRVTHCVHVHYYESIQDSLSFSPTLHIVHGTFTFLYCVSVFWAPLFLMSVCYVGIVVSLVRTERKYEPKPPMRRAAVIEGPATELSNTRRKSTNPSTKMVDRVPRRRSTIRLRITVGRKTSSRAINSHSRKMLKTAVTLMTVYFICYLPQNLNLILPGKMSFGRDHIGASIYDTLVLLSSVLNPLIYNRLSCRRK